MDLRGLHSSRSIGPGRTILSSREGGGSPVVDGDALGNFWRTINEPRGAIVFAVPTATHYYGSLRLPTNIVGDRFALIADLPNNQPAWQDLAVVWPNLSTLFESENDGAIPFKDASEDHDVGFLNRPTLANRILGFDLANLKPIWIPMPSGGTDILKDFFENQPDGLIPFRDASDPNNLNGELPPSQSQFPNAILGFDYDVNTPEWRHHEIRTLGTPPTSMTDPVISWDRQSNELQWKDNAQTLGIHSFGKSATFTPPSSGQTVDYTVGVNGSTTIPKNRLLRGTVIFDWSNPNSDSGSINSRKTILRWVSDNGTIKFHSDAIVSSTSRRSTTAINISNSGSQRTLIGKVQTGNDFVIRFTRGTGTQPTTVYVTEETTYLDETPSPSPTPPPVRRARGDNDGRLITLPTGSSGASNITGIAQNVGVNHLVNGSVMISTSDFNTSSGHEVDNLVLIDWTMYHDTTLQAHYFSFRVDGSVDNLEHPYASLSSARLYEGDIHRFDVSLLVADNTLKLRITKRNDSAGSFTHLRISHKFVYLSNAPIPELEEPNAPATRSNGHKST